MKRILVLALAMLMCLGALASCGAKDWAYIEEKGNLVIGITLFEPMNYYDESGKLVGFETEFAEAVCKKLGVEPVFQVIDWEQKENELKSRTIDVIWNGLTVTEERKENMAFSTAYVSNKQVVVIKDSNASKYATVEGMAGASCAAENGSAGETAIKSNAVLSQNKYVAAAGQKDVLMEVKAGTSEIGVIDLVMALASVDKGDYKDLMIVEGVELTAEEYAIGCRLEDTELLAKINAAIDEMVQDGSLEALAAKYGLSDVYAFKK
ncbi:MAG: transporter substrate-binding domain-containing protein [Ruminococcaceae bacterium]|nr:transporter substrate-binding domain-containing protein [Oscillospiraceae bacterium]